MANPLFELIAKLTLDISGYDKGVNEAEKKADTLAGKLKSGLGNIASLGGKAISGLAKVTTVGMGAATTAIGALTKQSLDSYADYEQLVGGVETLFGAGGKSIEEYAASVGKSVDEVKYDYAAMMEGQEKVLDNAAGAYKTAGLSANEYMETVTSFAASLVSSLGGQTDIAADVADTAISDMADNANKMGTSMESIQNAYQGFAKQNYTMLDNLKLGFGGTKEEMQRLLDTAGELTGREFDISNFADIVDAIHAVQDEMGITGTTAREASETISGSIASMKSAWSNLVTGLGSDTADIDNLVNQFVDSLGIAAGNIIPRIEQILQGVGTMIEKLAPILADQIPKLIQDVGPALLQAGATMLEGITNGLLEALPSLVDPAVDLVMQLIDFIVQNLPLLVDGAAQIIIALANGLADALPELVPAVVEAVILIGKTLVENIPLLLDAAWKIIQGLGQGLLDAFPELQVVWDALVEGFQNAWKWIQNVWNGVSSFFSAVWKEIQEIFSPVVEVLGKAFSMAWDAIKSVWNAVQPFFSTVWEGIKIVFSTVKDVLGSFFSGAWENIKIVWGVAKDFFQTVWNSISGIFDAVEAVLHGDFSGAWEAIKGVFSGVGDFFMGVFNAITNVFANIWDTFLNIGSNIVNGIAQGITNAWEGFTSWLSGLFDGLVNGVKNMLGIASPSKVFAGIGENMAKGLGKGWDSSYDKIADEIDDDMNFSGSIDTSGSSSYGAVGSGSYTGSTINITVNGANIQNDQELAERISFELQMLMDRRSAAFGT